MTLEAALYSHLIADVTITAIVGDRIHPMFFPEPEHSDIQEVQPFIVTQLESADVGSAQTHAIDGGRLMVNERWAVYCCSGRHDTMLSLFEAVIGSLDRFTDVFASLPGSQAKFSLESYSDDASFELGIFTRRIVFAVKRTL